SRPSSHSPYLSLHDASPTDIYSLSLHDALPILRLYVDKNRISPYAMSVYVALKEKGLDFQEIVIDLEQRQQKSAAYQAICPSAKVPCLIVDNFSLFESWAITEYLEDACPAPSYPALYPKEI